MEVGEEKDEEKGCSLNIFRFSIKYRLSSSSSADLH